MKPTCSAADLRNLAEALRAHGAEATVEADALRVRLPGRCYARPYPGGGQIGWAEGRDALWYGRFASIPELLKSARRFRRLRLVARTGLGLLGIWLTNLMLLALVPGYRDLAEDLTYLNVALLLCLLLGGAAWLLARFLRWRAARRHPNVLWVRKPWESA